MMNRFGLLLTLCFVFAGISTTFAEKAVSKTSSEPASTLGGKDEIIVSGKDDFKAVLPNGTEVELVAVDNCRSIGKLLHGPDGSKLDGPVYVRGWSSTKEGTAFALSIDSPTRRTDTKLRWADVKGAFGVRGGLRVMDMRKVDYVKDRWYDAKKFYLPKSDSKASVKIRLECDAWRTEVSYDGRYMTTPVDPAKMIVFSDSYETAEGVKVAFEHNIEGLSVRLIADALKFDINGKQVYGSVTVKSYVQTVVDRDGNEKQLALFRNVKLAHIKNFKLQTRRAYDITFADVSFKNVKHPITSDTKIKKYDMTDASDYMRWYFDTQSVGDYKFVEYEILGECAVDGKTGSAGGVAALATLMRTDGGLNPNDRCFYLYRWNMGEWEGFYQSRSNSIRHDVKQQWHESSFARSLSDFCNSRLKRIEDGYISFANVKRPAPAKDRNNNILPLNVGYKWDKAFGEAIEVFKKREDWPGDGVAVSKAFWDARAAKNYEEMKVLWPGSASWDWEQICKDDPDVKYVFGKAVAGRQRRSQHGMSYLVTVPYASKENFDNTGKYNLTMRLEKIRTPRGNRCYIKSGN